MINFNLVWALLASQVIQLGLSVLFTVVLLYLLTNDKTRPFMERGIKKIFEIQNGLLLILIKRMNK